MHKRVKTTESVHIKHYVALSFIKDTIAQLSLPPFVSRHTFYNEIRPMGVYIHENYDGLEIKIDGNYNEKLQKFCRGVTKFCETNYIELTDQNNDNFRVVYDTNTDKVIEIKPKWCASSPLPIVSNDIINKIINKYGKEQQYYVIIEECSELQKEICKCLRYDTIGNKDHIIEELSHVIFSAQVLMKILDISTEDIEKEFQKKYDKINGVTK